MLVSFFYGCGYHLKGGADTLPKDITAIAIEAFGNNSIEADMEALISSALFEAFSKTKRLKIVPQEEAHALLSGVITSISNMPVSFSSTDVVTDYRLTITLDVTFRRKGEGEVVWKGKGLSEIMDYKAAAGDVDLTENNRTEAKRELAREVADLIYDRIFEGF
ncbi:MAG: LPS assembly lipoprotein LptE [Deltaproteobacteria bacterium]|nr:LPS assembly lipoprotein LptE [Deltaproteobacteria bacterium]